MDAIICTHYIARDDELVGILDEFSEFHATWL